MQAFQYDSTLQCAQITLKQEGMSGFFRGMTQPLFTVSLIKSFTFSNYESMKPIIGVSASGFVSGFVTAIICCPLETAKIQLQLQRRNNGPSNIQFKGAIDCLLKLYQRLGIRGLFHGLGLQVSRDSIGSSLHFTTYEASKLMFRDVLLLSPGLSSLLAGGFYEPR